MGLIDKANITMMWCFDVYNMYLFIFIHAYVQIYIYIYITNYNNMNTHCDICIFNTSPWSIFGPQPNLLPIGGMESQAPFKSCFLRGFLVTRCDGPIVEIHLAHRSSNVYEAESTWDEAISKGWDWGKLIYRCNEKFMESQCKLLVRNTWHRKNN